jgi:glycosyltransferase involved in cell wall biosynthesis
VIAADIGGLGEVVADAGLRFAPGDPEALYICLREVIENPRAEEHWGWQRGGERCGLSAAIV